MNDDTPPVRFDLGPVSGSRFHARENLLRRVLGNGLSRTGNGEKILGPRRTGRTSVLRQIEMLVSPLSVGTPEWQVCWEALLAGQPPMDLRGAIVRTPAEAERFLRDQRPVLPVYVSFHRVFDGVSAASVLAEALADAAADAPEHPASSIVAEIASSVGSSTSSAGALIRQLRRRLTIQFAGNNCVRPIVWFLWDECAGWLLDGLRRPATHWTADLAQEGLATLDRQSDPLRPSCITFSITLPPSISDKAAEARRAENDRPLSSFLTRLLDQWLPLWEQGDLRRFLATRGSRFVTEHGVIWRALGGLPYLAQLFLCEESQDEDGVGAPDLLRRVLAAPNVATVVGHWEEDLGGEALTTLDSLRTGRALGGGSGGGVGAERLRLLGLLSSDGGGATQPLATFLTGGSVPLDGVLAFVVPDPDLEAAARSQVSIKVGQVAAVVLLPGDPEVGRFAAFQDRSWGISAGDLAALYAMAVAGTLAAPGLAMGELQDLAERLAHVVPHFEVVLEAVASINVASISAARKKLPASLAERFHTPGRNRSFPYGLDGEIACDLIPWLFVRSGGELRLERLVDARNLLSRLKEEIWNRRAQATQPFPALHGLFLALFSDDELRRFLRGLPDNDVVLEGIPGGTAPLAEVASETVGALQRRGYLVTDGFWEQLGSARPERREDIARVRALWQH